MSKVLNSYDDFIITRRLSSRKHSRLRGSPKNLEIQARTYRFSSCSGESLVIRLRRKGKSSTIFKPVFLHLNPEPEPYEK